MNDHEADPAHVGQDVPARLASVEVLEPWVAQLSPPAAEELACLATVLNETAGRLAHTATRLPEDDEGLVAALLLRTWASGVTETAASLVERVRKTAEASQADTQKAASDRLLARYAADPVRARRDGLDLLAGSLLPCDDRR